MRTIHTLVFVILIGLVSGCGPGAVETQTVRQASVLPVAAVPSATVQPTVAATAAPTPSVVPTSVAPTAAPTTLVEAAPTTPPAPEPTAPPTEPKTQGNIIVIDTPQPNAEVSSPLTLSGSANFWPFEATLVVELKDAAGSVLGRMPVMVDSPDVGQGGPWSGQLIFNPPSTDEEGTLIVYEASAKDGSILTSASVKVRISASAPAGSTLTFEEPAEDALVTLPLHVAFGGARGDEQLDLRLTLADGAVLHQETRATLGYVVDSIAGTEVAGAAMLEVVRMDGTVVARRPVRVATPEETQTVKVAWLQPGTEDVVLEERRVPRTPQIASAALNELLHGPSDTARFATSLPSSAEVLTYGGREAGWGAQVRLLKLVITDGVARADFSRELAAYGGGSARTTTIRQQIEQTLLQFPSVTRVEIAIEGQTEGILQP